MTLTKGQAEAIYKLNAFIKDPNFNEAVLVGYPGTGKSYTISQFLKAQESIGNYSITCVAPTHKAKKVLQGFVNDNALTYDVNTFASYLKLKQNISWETGDISFVPSRKTGEGVTQLSLIDEASMTRDDEYKIAKKHLNKIIWIGDWYQLPPVQANKVYMSMPFLNNLDNPYLCKLDEVVRYKGKILEYVLSLIDAINNDWVAFPDYRHLNPLPKSEWIKLAFEHFRSKEFKNDNNFCKIITFTNEATREYNLLIRDFLYGKKAMNSYLPGELCYAKDTIFLLNEHDFKNHIIAHAFDEVFIKGVDIATSHDGFLWYYLDTYINGHRYTITVIHEEDVKKWNAYLEELKKEAKSEDNDELRKLAWRKYYGHKNRNSNLIHTYAINVHASQGSTFENSFVDVYDIRKQQDITIRNKLFYVACSRAKEGLYLI